MSQKRVLFVCIHNSARSQMAEAFINHFAQDYFIAESAGIEPGKLNPIVVQVMKEIDIDISSNQTNSVAEFIKEGRTYDYLITVCDEASAQKCPIFPGQGKRVHFGFEDPSKIDALEEEKLKRTRTIRDQIRLKIDEFVKSKIST